MMVRGADLALCAARVRRLSEHLDENGRDQLVCDWRNLLDDIEGSRSEGAAEICLVNFRCDVEALLAKFEGRPAPLERKDGAR